SRVQGAARSAIDTVSERASTTYDAAAEQARRAGERFQNSASEMRGKVAERSRNFIDFICEQPLVLVGLGLALGAAIGAASPSSEAEEQLFERNQVKRPATSKEPQSATGDEGHGSAGDRAPHLDSGRNETPLVPSETSA